MTPDILLARIEAVEAVARAATPGPWKWTDLDRAIYAEGDIPCVFGDIDTREDRAHIAAWDPARVLAVCAGAKTLVELHGPIAEGDAAGSCATCSGRVYDEDDFVSLPCPTLAAVAAMFAEPGEGS